MVVFNMPREAPRTLFTLTPGYQNISPNLYEVIVIDNGSTPPLGSESVRSIAENFRYVYLEPGNPSPAHALNEGARRGKGQLLGFMVDGARMLSPGVLQYAIRAARAYRHPLVSTLGFHLGSQAQNVSSKEGYDQEQEDRLLESIDWRNNGYDLFQIAAFGGSCKHGWFVPIAESNCVFVTRNTFVELKGFNEAFDLPGGGLVNLDFYQRACTLSETDLVVLLGEGTFHQYHGGASTGHGGPSWHELTAQYRRIRGERYRMPRVRCDYFGHMPPSVYASVRDSLDRLDGLSQQRRKGKGLYDESIIPPNPLPVATCARRSIVMLGMHRSGTSVLAGSLQEAGLALGDVVTQAPHNQKGNRENRAIMFMQEDLLKCNGGAWDDPPETVRWEKLHTAVRDLFIARFEEERIWGFKDPRTLITLDGWLEALPNIEFVGIFRHPAPVVRSLQQRDRFPFDKSLKLWQVYNQRLLLLHKDHPFPLIEFQEDAAALRHHLQQLIRVLDLPFRHRKLTFFEDNFRRTSKVEIAMPPEVHQLYNELKERAI